MNWPFPHQHQPTLSQIQSKNNAFRTQIRNKQVEQLKNHLRSTILSLKNNHHPNRHPHPSNPHQSLYPKSSSPTFSVQRFNLHLNSQNILDELDKLLSDIMFCPYKLETNGLEGLQSSFFKINQGIVELRENSFQWQIVSSLYYESYLNRVESFEGENGSLVVEKAIDYLLTIQFFTDLEVLMTEKMFALIVQGRVHFGDDKYYKCYQLILHFFKLLQEENYEEDTVEIKNIPASLFILILTDGTLFPNTTLFHLTLEAQCLSVLLSCFSQNREFYLQIEGSSEVGQKNLIGSTMRLMQKTKDIMMNSEVDLREINSKILGSIEIMMEMDENGEFGEQIRCSFLPQYLLGCIFFQSHSEIEMKTLCLIFQMEEKYGIQIDQQNCLQLRYQQKVGDSQVNIYFNGKFKEWE